MRKVIRSIDYPLKTLVTIPGSKSITNRALLLGALSDGICELSNVLISDDTRAFAKALHDLGIMIRLDESTKSCIVGGGDGKFPRSEANVWCAQAGTVARFLLAACGNSNGIYHFDAHEQLRSRPLQELIKVLVNQGIKIIPESAKKMPFTIEGFDGLKGGEIDIDGSETGQFISALLMVAPFAKSLVTIKSKSIVGKSYVTMTCDMMAEFGVLVRRLPQGNYVIPVPQRYHARDYIVEPDLSSASYFFGAAAVTGGKVTIQAIDRKLSKQGDIVFLSILEKMGCTVVEEPTGLSVMGAQELRGVSVDMRHASDTFMTLAAIAPFATTPTSITNIGHTRFQESDRIKVMRTELEKLGVKVEEGPDWLKIYPSSPHAGIVEAHQDHRIAMAFSVLGLRVKGIEIEGSECVSKTYPEFFEIWDSLNS